MCTRCGNSICANANPYEHDDNCAICGEVIQRYADRDYYGEPICESCAEVLEAEEQEEEEEQDGEGEEEEEE